MVTPVLQTENLDPFNKLIADGTANELDIASQYTFSPERVRLYRNGSRAFPQYNTISQFSDDPAIWTLKPDAGDTMHIESAESSTYVVNYVLQQSQAFQLTQSLSDGDILRWGPYNGTDGWVGEQRGADHADDEFDVIEASGGTETTRASNVSLPKPTTTWQRYETTFGWYNVLNQEWLQTYTDGGTVINDTATKTSRDGARGPNTGNLNIWWEVQADASTTGLELEVGSGGVITLGQPTSLTRDKPQFEQITVSGTNDTWEPILAARIDPDKPNVNGQFSQLDILGYGTAADIELVLISVDPSKTDASGWGLPSYQHDLNSAMQSTESISQIPTDAGVQTDFGTSDKFGGHTIASAVEIDGGNASGTVGTANASRRQQKAVLSSDELIFVARTPSTGSDLSFVWDIDQDW